MCSILSIRSVKAVMSFHRKWMRLLPLYSSAVLNIRPCLPFHWKISDNWVNSRLQMDNNWKIENAALMPSSSSYFTLYEKIIIKTHGLWLTLPSFATASTSTSLAPRMNLVMTTGCSWRTNSSRLFKSVNRSRMQYLIPHFNCSVFRWGQSLLHKWVDGILKPESDRE